MTTHKVKIMQRFYDRIVNGEKTSELRENDRDYQTGDILMFDVLWSDHDLCERYVKEAERAKYKVTHVLARHSGLMNGYVVLSIKKTKK